MFSLRDSQLLIDLVPALKTVAIRVSSHCTEAYAMLFSSLHQLEKISSLSAGVLARITRPLSKLQSLTLSQPSQEDLSVINKKCPNLDELVVFLERKSKLVLSSSIVSTSLQKLVILSGVIVSLPMGLTFPSVTSLIFMPLESYLITADDFFFRLCELFPNLRHLSVRHPGDISSSTLRFICRELKSLRTLCLGALRTSELIELSVEQISRRRHSSDRIQNE